MYCGAIITMLFLTSFFWYTAAEPVAWHVPLPYAETPVGVFATRILRWLGHVSAPTADGTRDPTPPAGCSTGWTDLALAPGRSLFGLIPRPPACVTQAPTSDTRALFVGVPGTHLGFTLDWGLLLP